MFVPTVWHGVTPPPVTRSCCCVSGTTVKYASSVEELMKKDAEDALINPTSWIAPKYVPDPFRDDVSKPDLTLYTIEEVSKLLKVSKAAVRGFISDNKLEAIKLNKRVYRISSNSLNAFLKEHSKC